MIKGFSMLKKISLLSLIVTFGLSAPFGMTEENLKQWREEAKNSFEHLSPEKAMENKTAKQDAYSDFAKNVEEGGIFTDKLKSLENVQSDDGFLTAQERIKIISEIREAASVLQGSKDFIIYMFSSSVPRDAVTNIAASVSILQENGIKILSKQYLIGAPEEFQQYMVDWNNYLKTLPIKYQPYVVGNFKLKLDPRFFQAYKVDKVPAIAYAHCSTATPRINECKVDYLIRGDVSLRTFFDEISKQNGADAKFKEYVRILDANQIYKTDLKETKYE